MARRYQRRHTRRPRRPHYQVPLGHLGPEELLIHRELEYLRAVGGGAPRRVVAARRSKLDQVSWAVAP